MSLWHSHNAINIRDILLYARLGFGIIWVQKAISCMVVNHANGLHKSIAYGRADKFKPVFF